jgi:hypothetical protein
MSSMAFTLDQIEQTLRAIEEQDPRLWDAVGRSRGLRRMGIWPLLPAINNPQDIIVGTRLEPEELTRLVQIAGKQPFLPRGAGADDTARQLAAAVILSFEASYKPPRKFTDEEVMIAMKALNDAYPQLWDRIRMSLDDDEFSQAEWDIISENAVIMSVILKKLPFLTEEDRERHTYCDLIKAANKFAWSYGDKRHWPKSN